MLDEARATDEGMPDPEVDAPTPTGQDEDELEQGGIGGPSTDELP